MQFIQRYGSFLALAILSTQTALGMTKMPDEQRHFYHDKNLNKIMGEHCDLEKIERSATELCNTVLQETWRGRIFFNPIRYEQYLNDNPRTPWQALFIANAKMIEIITQQRKTTLHCGHNLIDIPSEQFKHRQCGIIYCETARELSKRAQEHNPAMACIGALKILTAKEYQQAYRYEPSRLQKTLHIALHRWNDCNCNNLYTAPLSRNIRK